MIDCITRFIKQWTTFNKALHILRWLKSFINSRRTCTARVTVLGLSVYDYSRTTGNEVACERYQQLQCNKRSKNIQAILLKRRRSWSRNCHYCWLVVRVCVYLIYGRRGQLPPPLRKDWYSSSLTLRNERVVKWCCSALSYCCFQPGRNWLTSSDDEYRTFVGSRGPAKWFIRHCLVACTRCRGFAL